MTITAIRSGAAVPAPAARRLKLSRHAMRWLIEQLPGDPPPTVSALVADGLMVTNDPVHDELLAAGVVQDVDRPVVVDAFLRTWAVLTSPRELIEVQVRGTAGGWVAVLATRGDFGVGVVQVDPSTVELSAWIRPRMRDELSRLVPAPELMRGRPSITSALGGPSSLPEDSGPVDVTEGAVLSGQQGRVDVGVFVLTGEGPAAGKVHWVCAGDQWWRLVGRGTRVMAEPVAARDLAGDVFRLLTAAGTWLAAVPESPGAADLTDRAEPLTAEVPNNQRRHDVC